MDSHLPEILIQGESSRLFPVLSMNSKEARATSILLSSMIYVEEFGAQLFATIGQKRGKLTKIKSFTEVVFKGQNESSLSRPDGLIVLTTSTRKWMALVETKVGNNKINSEQVERYRNLAKENNIDCVITISNQFATSPDNHPVEEIRQSRSKIPVFHWSWMSILTATELLVINKEITDETQLMLLNELRRFLSHESTGVRGFDRMPKEWAILNKTVSTGGGINVKSPEVQIVLDSWHQETRDLSLILSRMTGVLVKEKLMRKHLLSPNQRKKDEKTNLQENFQLKCSFEIPDTAGPIDVVADLRRRTVEVGITLKAPEDRKSTKARLNWLLRQIKSENTDDLFIKVNWPGSSISTQFSYNELMNDVTIADDGKKHLVTTGFHVYYSKRLGPRFTQVNNFISDIENIVPDYYSNIGSNLIAWKKPAPKIHKDRISPEDVSPDAITEDAELFQT